MFILISFGFIAIRIPDILAQEPPPALKQDSSLMAQAQLEFSKRHYVEALELYRTYLRSYPEDQDAWTRFAAAYYYTGQAKQALLYLQKAKPSIKLKGFSLFYQALCLDALGDRLRSKRYLLRVAKLDDPLAEDALFELIAIVYEDADVIATRTLSEEYLRRFREGRFRTQIEWLNSRLALAGKLNVEGTQRSRYRSSFFEQHPLSILTVPHIWHYQLGYYFERGTRSNPGYGRSKPVVTSGVAYEEFNLNANAGIGLGPFKGKGTESFAGYIYEQEWLSNADRLKVWTDDTSDLQYFPFRPDLMERHHRFYVETLGHSGNFLFGAYAHWQILRAGSESFPAPERPEIRKAFDVGTENLFVPWVEWNYH
ncbi:MAG: tetratricopeptide repeat protein, partial [Proteobacteria bacterium]|nr:tetratricopeptide repeat protein [Pseudomonadota bacterium]